MILQGPVDSCDRPEVDVSMGLPYPVRLGSTLCRRVGRGVFLASPAGREEGIFIKACNPLSWDYVVWEEIRFYQPKGG